MNVQEAMQVFGLDFMVYPNPASDRVTIGFNNANHSEVTIDLLDISGKIIERIASRELPAGMQTINWNTSNTARGMYFVRVSSNAQSITRPLILSE
jgi:hypothetical protein